MCPSNQTAKELPMFHLSDVRCQSSGREAGGGCNTTGPAGDATSHENRLAGLIQTQVRRSVTDWQPEHLDLLQRP